MMESSKNLDFIIQKAFRKKGLKITPQRMAISRLIFHDHKHEHPSVKKIYLEVKKLHPSMSLTTVYKTIKILKDSCLVLELNPPLGQERFDPNMEPYAHLICLQCGDISDWMNPALPKLLYDIETDSGFTAVGSSLDIYGMCEACHEKSKDAEIRGQTRPNR
jgi:Fur family peroxide stress response transcriptional regulator